MQDIMLSLWHVAASRRVNITSQEQYTIEAPSHLSPGHKNNRKKAFSERKRGGKNSIKVPFVSAALSNVVLTIQNTQGRHLPKNTPPLLTVSLWILKGLQIQRCTDPNFALNIFHSDLNICFSSWDVRMMHLSPNCDVLREVPYFKEV